jgi:hypothetical protein
MYPYARLGLRVAKHHGFDEVAERQEPVKTHRLRKERISPQREGLSLHGRVI